jgi:hypothetical protein
MDHQCEEGVASQDTDLNFDRLIETDIRDYVLEHDRPNEIDMRDYLDWIITIAEGQGGLLFSN